MLLEIKNIYKNYIQGNMEVPVLKDINLSVEEGEYLAIMGPSGSGKSTLMNIIGCIDKPTSGTYMLDGQEINNLKDKELSFVRNKQIGFVFQTFNLMPRQSALENVALPLLYAKVPKRDRKKMCLEALDMVGLSERVNFKPTQLSGGQKQRVAIARAMVNQPKILLADEPTGALDSKSGIQVMKLFRELHERGTTIIMITHSDEIAGYADRMVKIIDGELVDAFGNRINGNVSEQESEDELYTPDVDEVSGQEVEQ
ncbi:MAG: ABC transporter ATP-binding protein [Lachnospiraceae bacterium]|nr:ABC transporter ATP-binding protein [Lachnospiraceae bacterium]